MTSFGSNTDRRFLNEIKNDLEKSDVEKILDFCDIKSDNKLHVKFKGFDDHEIIIDAKETLLSSGFQGSIEIVNPRNISYLSRHITGGRSEVSLFDVSELYEIRNFLCEFLLNG